MKRDNWKQLGPQDQSTAILASIGWWLDVIELVNPDVVKSMQKIRGQLKEVKELCQDYLPEKW